MAGAQFDIYLVATVNESGKLRPAGDFDGFNVDIRGEDGEVVDPVALSAANGWGYTWENQDSSQ